MHRLGWIILLIFLTGCSFAPPALPPTPTAALLLAQQEIETALLQASFPQSQAGSCQWDVLGQGEGEIYVWATCTQTSPMRSAVSAPAVIYVDDAGGIRNVRFPDDGMGYAPSIRKLFPPDIQELIFNYDQSGPTQPADGETTSRKVTPTPLPQSRPPDDRQARPPGKILYARADGSVFLQDLITGQELELLGPESYRLDSSAGEGYFLLPMLYPITASPNEQWLIIPTQRHGTWLVAADGSQRRQISEHPLATSWAPDSRHITYTHNWGQQHPDDPNVIFVQDVVGGGAEQRLAELPAQVSFPLWSPACMDDAPARDCGRHIVASTHHSDRTTLWLVDAGTGAYEELCRYTPRGTESVYGQYLWSQQGDAVWSLGGWRVCPVDDRPPLPISRTVRPGPSSTSPDQKYGASVEGGSTILVYPREGCVGTAFDEGLHNVHSPLTWLDNENLLVVMGPEQGHDIYIMHLFDGKLTPVARNVTFLGELSHLRQLQVLPNVTDSELELEILPAGPEDTWQTRNLPEMNLTLRVPAGWRLDGTGRGRYVISNVRAQSGMFALPPEALEIVISRTYGNGLDINPGTWLRQSQQSLAFGHKVERTTLAGRPALHVIDKVEPLWESWHTVKDNYEIIIERAPLNSDLDAIFQQMLASIQFE